MSTFIDTGSPNTNICSVELEKIGLSLKHLIDKDDFKPILLGGAKHKGHVLRTPVEFKFKCGKEIISLNSPTVYVLLPFRGDKIGIKQSRGIPNIIGVDFLQHHNLGLYFNPSKNIAYLEKD